MKSNVKTFVKNKFKQMMKGVAMALARWMYRHRKQIVLAAAMITLLAMVLDSCDADAATMAFAVIAGVEGGEHVVDGPLTTDVVHERSDDYLLNELDKQVTKIRPMATPIDQLSRLAGSRRCHSMVVDYYNVDTKPTSCAVKTRCEGSAGMLGVADNAAVKLSTTNDAIFDVSDTILVQGVKGYDAAGKKESNDDLVLYVVAKGSGNELTVIAVNGQTSGDVENCVPEIEEGRVLIRMGRAASELDVQTAQFEAMPKKATQNCQIFKAQVEQSVLHKISDKEITWSLNDQGEAALYDMRLGMEKSFLFGAKSRIYDTQKREYVYLTGGIWPQAGKEFEYDGAKFNEEVLVDMMREAFTGNAGSKRKVLIGGSGFISRLNKLSYSKVVSAGESVVKWGLDFSELRSKFGTLYVLLSEVFDECGMSESAMIVDPEYMQKYSHLPFGSEALDLKASGQRNTDAIVLTEASCLVLRYPKAHMRIVPKA